jgi:hypothetical protein
VPSSGAPVLASGITLRYSSTADRHGADDFSFVIADSSGAQSPAAIVPITVTAVNDTPISHSAAYVVSERQTLPLVLSATDVDGDTLTYALASVPSGGTLTLATGEALPAPGDPLPVPAALLYTPPANTDETFEFAFTATDGAATSASATISVEVRNVPDAPLAQGRTLTLAEDTSVEFTLEAADPEGDSLVYVITVPPASGMLSYKDGRPMPQAHEALPGPGVLVYTPDPDFNGTDPFSFVARDATQESAPAVVNLVVTPVNDAPRALAQSLSTPEDTKLPITLSGSDGWRRAPLHPREPSRARLANLRRRQRSVGARLRPPDFGFLDLFAHDGLPRRRQFHLHGRGRVRLGLGIRRDLHRRGPAQRRARRPRPIAYDRRGHRDLLRPFGH